MDTDLYIPAFSEMSADLFYYEFTFLYPGAAAHELHKRSLEMTGTEETLSWLNESLQQYFVKEALLKHTALSEITVYRHRSTDKKLLVRRSRNRNDEVYRLLLTARLPHLPQIYEVISTPEELIVLEEYLEGEPLAARLESGPLSKAHAYRYTRQLCQAAGALHRPGDRASGHQAVQYSAVRRRTQAD